jgi:hypothetical protein
MYEFYKVAGCNNDCALCTGVSIWRIKKCSSGSQLETSNSFLVEKIYNFESCSEWVSKLIFEPLQNRAYAISDTSVTILDLKKRKVEFMVSDLHETPVTACIWYPGDKFYITACMNGIVRCWFVKERERGEEGGEQGCAAEGSSQAAVSLHTFNAHARAVSGLYLHPRPGLLITAGMDACVKVFDLEAFTQIQSIQTSEGITHFTLGECSANPVCLFAHLSGELVMWRIESCCREFSACTSNILSLTAFENMNEYYSMHKSQICYDESETLGANIGFDKYDVNFNQNSSVGDHEAPLASTHKVVKTASVLSIKSQDVQSTVLPQYISDLDKTVHEKMPPIMSRNASAIMEDEMYDENFKKNKCMVAFAGHDLQILSVTGAVLSRCTADMLIDGVTHYTFSVFQQLLFCILENGALRVFCTRSPLCTLLREISIGALSSDKATALVLVEGMSLGPLRSSATSKDMRGEPSPLNVNEAILIGTINGVLLCFDTFQECALVLTQQVSKSELEGLKYRPFRNELVVIAKKNISSALSTVKVFKVPDMILTHSIQCDHSYSCAGISSVENYMIIGCKQGTHQFFKLFEAVDDINSIESVKRFNVELTDTDSSYGRFTEVLNQDSDHSGSVTGVSFCDKLNAYATSALDSAIKFWDFKKKCLKTILLDVPSRDVLFNWPVGHLIVTQREKLQSIPYDSWSNMRPTGQEEEGGEDEDDWGGFEKEPQSSPPSSAKAVSRQTTSSKPHTGVTFLTDQDRDELAEVAFLEAALQANGNLEDYWLTHSSVAFGRKSNTTRSAKSTYKGKKGNAGGVKFDVRNPSVPIPPRRTKSNYFKRKSQKELEAQLIPPSPPRVHSTPTSFGKDQEGSDTDDEFDDCEPQGSSDVEANALEELFGRQDSRGVASGKSLLLKTKSFARKISMNVVAKRNGSLMNVSTTSSGRQHSTAGDSLNLFHTVQNAKSRPSVASDSGGDALARFVGKQGSVLSGGKINEGEGDGEEVELFVKPNGPKGKNARDSFKRVRPKLLMVTTGKNKPHRPPDK